MFPASSLQPRNAARGRSTNSHRSASTAAGKRLRRQMPPETPPPNSKTRSQRRWASTTASTCVNGRAMVGGPSCPPPRVGPHGCFRSPRWPSRASASSRPSSDGCRRGQPPRRPSRRLTCRHATKRRPHPLGASRVTPFRTTRPGAPRGAPLQFRPAASNAPSIAASSARHHLVRPAGMPPGRRRGAGTHRAAHPLGHASPGDAAPAFTSSERPERDAGPRREPSGRCDAIPRQIAAVHRHCGRDQARRGPGTAAAIRAHAGPSFAAQT